MQSPTPESYSLAEARKHLSEFIGRVAFGGESIVITRHGRPMARLVPVGTVHPASLAEVWGWLENDDPFFEAVDEVVGSRGEHGRARQRLLDLSDVDEP